MTYKEAIAKIDKATQRYWKLNQQYKGHSKKDIDWLIGQILEHLYQIELLLKEDEA